MRERVEAIRPARGPSRRAILKAGAAGLVGVGLGRASAAQARTGPDGRDAGAVVLVAMLGGAGGRETFDPKPDATAEVRGPLGSIASAVPGVMVCEFLPEIARRLDRVALIRSMTVDAPPTHHHALAALTPSVDLETGGRAEGEVPSVVLVGPVEAADLGWPLLADAWIDPVDAPAAREIDRARRGGPVRPASGRSPSPALPALCRRAADWASAGARLVVVAGPPRGRGSWDAHGRRPFATFDDLRASALPAFDLGFSGLIDDLDRRGLLGSTTVVGTGEFGRAPRVNESGGRDHWTGSWSSIVAGGGIPGGLVVGSTDLEGAWPADRPVDSARLGRWMAERAGLAGGSSPIGSAGGFPWAS